MKSIKYITSLCVTVVISALILTTSVNCFNTAVAEPVANKPTQQQTVTVSSLAVVSNPKAYLNKTIVMTAKFDKFSTLGLDYKTAYKPSSEYISFLIKRDDSTHNIPLSEMKLFLKRKTAEKFIDLKTDDVISITGMVFSDALGDPWVDVQNIKILEKAPAKEGASK